MSARDLIDAYLEHLRLIGRSPYTTYEWSLILRRADRELPIGLDYAGDQELLAWLGRDDWSPAYPQRLRRLPAQLLPLGDPGRELAADHRPDGRD